MVRVDLEKLLALLRYTLDLLANGEEDSELLLTDGRYDDSGHEMAIDLREWLALVHILHFSLLALPDFNVLLTSNDELLEFPLRLDWEDLETVMRNAILYLEESLDGQVVTIDRPFSYFIHIFKST